MSSTDALWVSTQKQLSHFFEEKTKISVACSGGIDSTVLFHILFSMIKDKTRLAICHVNYGLRAEETQREVAFLRQLAVTYGVSFFLQTVSEEERRVRTEKNIQIWAR